MSYSDILNWLLEGDVSVQYQLNRDLLSIDRPDLRERIGTEGFGAKFLSCRRSNGHWGNKFYHPKWTSTHYTLLDLRNLCLDPTLPSVRESIQIIVDNEKAVDGGILSIGPNRLSDLCINGMFLNYASYFQTNEKDLKSVVDCILNEAMPDGGFNCRSNRMPTFHSSMHTTISVLEGVTEYQKNGYIYKSAELEKVKLSSIEFLLMHQLFLSDRTGEIIDPNFLKLVYPCRWKYDILRALDYFQYEGIPWEDRLQPAIEVIIDKRKKSGVWNNYSKHPGQVHFEMEKAGQPGRWNTLRALRVFKYFGIEIQNRN